MRVIFVKAKGVVNKEGKEIIKNEIRQGLKEGLIVYDDFLDVDVLDFDNKEVTE